MQHALDLDDLFTVGAPAVSNQYGCPERVGYIAKIDAAPANLYTLGSGRMERETRQVVVVWNNRTFSDVSGGIARPWLEAGRRSQLDPVTEAEALAMLSEAKAAETDRRAQQAAEREAYAAKVSAWRDSIRDKIPADAKAVIVAELEEDKSDSMTDYFATATAKTVILGFSTHTRDIFSEMRKAAKNYKETQHLVDAGPEAEHREKYSMGAGYYLKATHRYSSGWKVCKHTLYLRGNDLAECIPYGEWSVPEHVESEKPEAPKRAAKREQTSAEQVGNVVISEHTHTKKGFAMFIVQPPERVAPEMFATWLQRARDARGWYSRPWAGTPGGFAFKDHDAAVKFAESLNV